jgi:F-type H+-transporting ATPase subunit b
MKTLAAVLSVLAPAVALAAGGGDAHHDPAHTTSAQWWTMAFMCINLGLFVALMVRFTRAPLRDYLIDRRKELVEAMAEAARAKEEADRTRREYEEKLAALADIKRELAEEIGRIAEADRERTLTEARDAAGRMKQESERTARSDFERARRELRAEAARLATELASTQIGRRLDEGERHRLLGEFLKQVEAADATERSQ